jgi:tripartite-type tricarboxylate transporter receptor subunit TctC
MINRRVFLAGTMAIVSAPARAADWPIRTVKVVVPFGAGGITDTAARIACEQLSSMYPHPFIVENRVGAGGNIAAEYVVRANDDHILMFATPSQINIAPLLQKLAHEPRRNLKPIARLFQSTFVLSCNPSLGVSTLPELVELLRKSPGKYNYGSPGAGTVVHLVTELFRARAQVDVTHVPYTGGSALMTDLLGDRIQLVFGIYSDVAPLAEAGKIKMLAVTASKRLKSLPSVPCVSEMYPGLDLDFWNGFVAPAALSLENAVNIAGSLRTVVAKPSVTERFAKLGILPVADTPEAFAKQLDEDDKLFGAAVIAAGLAPK